MQDSASDLDAAVRKMGKREWLARIDDLGEELGYFQTLGSAHYAFFHDDTPSLLVTFETVDSIRARGDDQLPLGLSVARGLGWSHLCIIADGDTWFRDKAVYGYLDRLVDDAFFEDFDQVVFYGAGMGGYAAAAFSVVAPGASVVLVQPQATLDPAIAGWDRRFDASRRLSFTDRYGYAPDMIEGAGPVYVIYDPQEPMDAMHAALFTRPFVTKLPCRNLGSAVEHDLLKMEILPRVLARAGTGRLDGASFYRLYRARRGNPAYLRALVARLEHRKRTMLIGLLCRNVADRTNAPRFRRRLELAEQELAAAGRTLPAQRAVAHPR